MSSVGYRGYTFQITSRPTNLKLWLSTAKVHCNAGRISFTAIPSKKDGYSSQAKAEEATERFVKDWIDRREDRTAKK